MPSATFFSLFKKNFRADFHWSKTNSTWFVLFYNAAIKSYSASKFSPVFLTLHIFLKIFCWNFLSKNSFGNAEFKWFVLRIGNYLFQIRIQLFRVLDPDPCYYLFAYLENKKIPVRYLIIKEESMNYLPFSLAGFGSETIIPDPDPTNLLTFFRYLEPLLRYKRKKFSFFNSAQNFQKLLT